MSRTQEGKPDEQVLHLKITRVDFMWIYAHTLSSKRSICICMYTCCVSCKYAYMHISVWTRASEHGIHVYLCVYWTCMLHTYHHEACTAFTVFYTEVQPGSFICMHTCKYLRHECVLPCSCLWACICVMEPALIIQVRKPA